MTNLKYITKNNNNLKDKPRVYFTCHPQDFEQTFERLTNDIFKTQDCVIYYTENMADRLPEDSRETDLDRMNLFVIPVTKKLLDEHNRAMDEDYAFAVKHNIPVLPLKMEILKIKDNKEDMEDYNKKFSYSHYIEPDNSYNYEKKLETYLKSVLLDDGTIERIRKAFDAYIFLSYRKKDKNMRKN